MMEINESVVGSMWKYKLIIKRFKKRPAEFTWSNSNARKIFLKKKDDT
jgi:hypothetical protein